MANNTIQLKRSSVAGKQPNTSTLAIGELALNLTDQKLYSSNGTGIFEPASNVSSLYVGNSSVYTTVNSTAFSGTANNATNAFGKTEGNLNVNSALTSNNSTYSFGKTESDLNVNNALTSNNSSYLGGTAAASYVQNTDSRTLSGNLNFTGTNTYFSGQVTHASNVILSSTVGISANGDYGTEGQVLTSNGSTVYWADSTGGSGSGIVTQQQYTGDGTTTTFNFTGGYTSNTLSVYLNGVLLRNGTEANVVNGSTFSITPAPASGALIDAIGFSGIYANGVSAVVSQQFTANGTANSFTVTSGYVPNQVLVFVNGVKQIPGTDVDISSGSTINLTTTPANGYVIDLYGSQSIVGLNANNLTVGNVVIGVNQISVGNSSVNTQIVAGNVFLNGSTLVVGNTVSNITVNSSAIAVGGNLVINSTAVYVSGSPLSGTNTDAQYTWTNTQTFSNTITFNSTINGTVNNAVYLNGIAGSLYQTNAGLAANVATLAANAATYLNGKPESNLNVNNALYLNGNAASNFALLSGATFTGAVTISGNLTVTGNVTTINANNLSVVDNMIYLNANNTVTNPDLGFAGNYNDGSYRHAGFFRDATDGIWKVFDSYTPEPDASPYIDTSNASFHIADFQANTLVVASLKANGSVGSANQVLTSNGSTVYWANASGGATVSVSDSAPGTPQANSLWWKSDEGRLYIYYNDGSSSQWVAASPDGAGQYLPLAGGTVSGDLTTTNTVTIGTAAYHVANGNMGVGTSSPAYRLDVNGTSAFRNTINTSAGIEVNTLGTGDRNAVIDFHSDDTYTDYSFRLLAALGANGLRYIRTRGTGGLAIENQDVAPMTFATSATERMRIDSNGNVTMPYQTSFHATGGSTQSWSGSANYQTLQLNTSAGMGSRSTNYNTSTYRFTAPVAGAYMFYGKITTTTNGATGPEAVFAVNGAAAYYVAINYGPTGAGSYTSSSGQVIIQLSAGDYVELKVVNNNNVTFTLDLTRSCFGGHLIG